MYRLGITPWDHDNLADQLTALAEGPDALAPGNALDIGCGGGRDAIYLAGQGWTVTGVDVVPRASATIDALTDPGATMLVFAFQPGRRGPAPRGLDRDELHSASRAGR
jgi:SAM-dependent methyltransferase